MSTQKIAEEQLKNTIQKALKKINGSNENAICRYLPGETGQGYMHHFTYRKLKTQHPEELNNMINNLINDANKPHVINPKQRAPRGSRKRQNQLNFSKQDIDRILQMARIAGDKDIIRKLARKDLKTIKRELIQSIKQGRVEQELWHSYVDSMTNQAQIEELAHKHALV